MLQLIANDEASALTASLKVTAIVLVDETVAAPLAGVVEETVGALSADVPVGVSEKSSIAKPSSLPEMSESFQRIQNVAPLAIASVGITKLTDVRFCVALPSNAPTVVLMLALLKSRLF